MITEDGRITKLIRAFQWLPSYAWQCVTKRGLERPAHLILALADHFEPAIQPAAPSSYADLSVQAQRLDSWYKRFPKLVDDWRDAEGFPFRHTYFYPAEQYDKHIIEGLVEHCRAGWGEIEVHLHHGVERPDTAEQTRKVLLEFRDILADYGCLSYWEGQGPPRYAFVHGNWALGNCLGGRHCGVDNELEILAETGCYADFTLPAAPSPAQVSKINAVYECVLPLNHRAPHRRGRDLRRGCQPHTFPIIISGPLGVNFARRINGWAIPCIENGAVTTQYPASIERLRYWCRAGIGIEGCPDWLFVKLHCHGMDPRDEVAMLGEPMRQFLRDLLEWSEESPKCCIHFVTAREMVNIALAACDGKSGNPGEYRDYKLRTASRGGMRLTKPVEVA